MGVRIFTLNLCKKSGRSRESPGLFTYRLLVYFRVPGYQNRAKTLVYFCVESSQGSENGPSWSTTQLGGLVVGAGEPGPPHWPPLLPPRLWRRFLRSVEISLLEFSFPLLKIHKHDFADYPNECSLIKRIVPMWESKPCLVIL